MKLFEWSDDLTTNVQTIDAQHHEYARRTNRFLRACTQQGASRVQLVKIFCFLTDYANQHLCFEEKLMREFLYPGTRGHMVQHERLRKFIKETMVAIPAAETTITSDFVLKVNYMLVDWFRDHIRVEDRVLTTFLIKKAKSEHAPRLLKLIKGILGMHGVETPGAVKRGSSIE